MPFQPNTAQFLQFLQQQRDAKLQAQQDTMKAALAQRKAQFAELATLKKEKRLDARHTADMRKADFDYKKALREEQDTAASRVPGAEAAGEDIANRTAQDYDKTRALFRGSAENEAAGFEPSEPGPVLDGQQTAGFNQTLGIGGANEQGISNQDIFVGNALIDDGRRQAFAPLEEQSGLSIGELKNRSQVALRAAEKQDGIEVRKEIVKEKREAQENDRRARRGATIAAAAKSKGIAAMEAARIDHLASANENPPGSQARKYHTAVAEQIKFAQETDPLIGLTAAGAKIKSKKEDLKGDYRELRIRTEILRTIAKNPQLIGPQASIHTLARKIEGFGVDLQAVLKTDLAELATQNLDDGTPMLEDGDVAWLRKLASGTDPQTGSAIAQVRLNELLTGWYLARSANRSGRNAKDQIKAFIDSVKSTGMWTPSTIGADNLTAAADELELSLWQMERRLDAEGIAFGDDGLSEDPPMPGVGILAPRFKDGPNATGGGQGAFTMPAPALKNSAEYDKLTPEEQKAWRDKAVQDIMGARTNGQ